MTSSCVVPGTLAEAIIWSLSNCLWSNAIFLAERYHASSPSDETRRLLAECYHRQGRIHRAYNILKGIHIASASHQTRYLLAVCCYELGKFSEAETALEEAPHANHSISLAQTLPSNPPVPIVNGAAGYHLMGMICKKANQRGRAATYLRKSLDLNPFMWSAYEELCSMGESVDAAAAFVPRNNATFKQPAPTSGIPPPSVLPPPSSTSSLLGLSPVPMSSSMSESSTPTFAGNSRHLPGLIVPPPLASPISPAPGGPGGFVSSPSVVLGGGAPPRRRRMDDASKRKTGRLFGEEPKSKVKSRLSFATSDTPVTGTGTTRSGSKFGDNTSKKEPHTPQTQSITHLQPQSPSPTIFSVLVTIGTAYKLLCDFRCKEAISTFQQLPSSQFQTGWVLCQVGRAYFEMVDYPEAQLAFQQARKVDPNRVEGMEIYSTILWHMRKDSELSYLAHELVEIDKNAPQSWCVVGNCFSLQKEHETALKFFQRAIQLDNSFTYAYTLSGHEYVANDDLEKAFKFFRHALDMDPRHYNAWYGLGMIYYRQEKYELAEYHFKRALSINNISSVLYCYYGMISHAHDKPEQALAALETAIAIDPHNTLAKFKKASVLVTLLRYTEALSDLESLKDFAPKEAPIYFLLGRIYRRLGSVDRAMVYYMMALDLDPKNANYIKSIIEKVHTDPEDDEDTNNELP